MKKILFLGAGSEKDPGFEGLYDAEDMKQKGIDVIGTVIESCHGCFDLMSKYSKEMQDLVEQGNRVVGVLQGGLYFALPSIQTTQTTFPIISCPLDIVAYQAFVLPSGHAAIGTVAVESSQKGPHGKPIYETMQRQNALRIAKWILNSDDDSVRLWGDGNLEKLANELDILGIKVSDRSGLSLTYGISPDGEIGSDAIQVWADSKERLTGEYFDRTQQRLSMRPLTIQVKGYQNLAIYAAKILSLANPSLREKIEKIKTDKRNGYETRDLRQELGGQ